MAWKIAIRQPAFGHERRVNCARNEAKLVYHIWDYRNADGHMGAVACVVLPSLTDRSKSGEEWRNFAWRFTTCLIIAWQRKVRVP